MFCLRSIICHRPSTTIVLSKLRAVLGRCWLLAGEWEGGNINNLSRWPSSFSVGLVDVCSTMFLTNFSLLRSFFSTSPFLVSFRDRKIFVRSPFFDFLFSSVVNFPAQFDLRCMFDHVWLRGSLCKLCVIIGACLRVDCLCFTPPSPPAPVLVEQ